LAQGRELVEPFKILCLEFYWCRWFSSNLSISCPCDRVRPDSSPRL